MDPRARRRSNWHYLFGVLALVGAVAFVAVGPLVRPQGWCDVLSPYMRCRDGAVARCDVVSSSGQRARSNSADLRALCGDGSTLSVAPIYFAAIPLGLLGVALGVVLLVRGYRVRFPRGRAVQVWTRPPR
jgi:hypothetical protein